MYRYEILCKCCLANSPTSNQWLVIARHVRETNNLVSNASNISFKARILQRELRKVISNLTIMEY